MRIRPVFPDMATHGPFRQIRQPALWTTPDRIPDQLAPAISFTACCRRAPRHATRFDRYRAEVPYMLAHLTAAKDQPDAQ